MHFFQNGENRMRTLMKTLSGGMFALLISACATTLPSDSGETTNPEPVSSTPDEIPAQIDPTPEDQANKDTCGAAPLNMLIGKSIAAVQMLADQNIRIIGVDTMVTKDFRPDRINIKIDEVATITDIYCG